MSWGQSDNQVDPSYLLLYIAFFKLGSNIQSNTVDPNSRICHPYPKSF